MASATMNKGMTFFKYVGRTCEVTSTDTIAQAVAAMRKVFTGPVHEVTFHITEGANVPPVATQLRNRLAKLKKIAAQAGFCVPHFDVRGGLVVCKVAA